MKSLIVIIGAVLASMSALAQSPQTIKFSGYTWTVKSSASMGPGPNAWSPKNVWVDSSGQLHLRIADFDGKWECAEVDGTQRLGFGTYEFQVTGWIDRMDPGDILGLFNYPTPDVGPDGTNEIDIEFGRWGNAAWPNGNFTVWPAIQGQKNGSNTFNFSLKSDVTTNRFVWTSKSIAFESLTGSQLIHSWTYAPAEYLKLIPQHPEPAMMNLWLFQGKAPKDGKAVEIVVKSFKFTPEAGS